MIIFGGFESGARVNTLSRFSFATRKWDTLKPSTGPLPEPRAGHSAAVFKDTLIVFGGKNEENEKMNDVWSFNFKNNTWTQM